MLDKIKNSCKYVVENSQHVKIDYSKLDDFIANIDCNNLKNWLLYNPYNLLDLDIETLVNFLLVFESIDYSFWGQPKWTIETEDGLKDGSDALLYDMLKYAKKLGNATFNDVSFNEFRNILKGNIEIPFLEERYKTISEINEIVNKKMSGNFYKYIKNITSDTELFNLIINNFESFKDERIYDGKVIYFYKLAQLLTSDILHLREEIEKITVDYSNLIGCADYKIPQVLRALGITEYDKDLSYMVDNKKEIEISSKYEVEIRASQIFVLGYIKNRLNSFKSVDINDFLFNYSKKLKNIVKPYHLCRNKNY